MSLQYASEMTAVCLKGKMTLWNCEMTLLLQLLYKTDQLMCRIDENFARLAAMFVDVYLNFIVQKRLSGLHTSQVHINTL